MYALLALGTADTLHEHGPSLSANILRRSLAVMDTSTSDNWWPSKAVNL
jgi:hypothetical protein